MDRKKLAKGYEFAAIFLDIRRPKGAREEALREVRKIERELGVEIVSDSYNRKPN